MPVTSRDHIFSPLFLSRRREARFDVAGFVRAHPASPGAPVALAVHDLSFRGFAIDTVRAVAPGTVARFRFETLDTSSVTAKAIAVHCCRLRGPKGLWRSGWEFPEQPGLALKIERLLGAAVGVLTIE